MLEIVPVDRPLSYPPRVTAFTRRFWEGLALGLFRTTRCDACHQLTFPPKPICPNCWGKDVRWEEVGADGTLYSWTRIHAGPAVFEAELPYAVGVVDLDAGIRVACRLWPDSHKDWGCGMAVRMIALEAPDGALFAAAPR